MNGGATACAQAASVPSGERRRRPDAARRRRGARAAREGVPKPERRHYEAAERRPLLDFSSEVYHREAHRRRKQRVAHIVERACAWRWPTRRPDGTLLTHRCSVSALAHAAQQRQAFAHAASSAPSVVSIFASGRELRRVGRGVIHHHLARCELPVARLRTATSSYAAVVHSCTRERARRRRNGGRGLSFRPMRTRERLFQDSGRPRRSVQRGWLKRFRLWESAAETKGAHDAATDAATGSRCVAALLK